MWDLIKSLFGAIFDIIGAVLGFIWDIVVWLFGVVVDIALWIFEKIIALYFNVLSDLIVNYPASFLVAVAILGGGYYLIDKWQKDNDFIRSGVIQNPALLFIVLVPITTLLIGVLAESGPVSIVNNMHNEINVGGNVDGGSTVQIGTSEGGLLSMPTAVWAAAITGIATVTAAFIALRKK